MAGTLTSRPECGLTRCRPPRPARQTRFDAAGRARGPGGLQSPRREGRGQRPLQIPPRYKAFGEDRHTSGTTPTTFRYTGQRQESLIGLYYYGARWYDAALGRFAQADTVIPSIENPQSLNRYSYVYNRPLLYIDGDGHIPIPLIIPLIALAVAFIFAVPGDTGNPTNVVPAENGIAALVALGVAAGGWALVSALCSNDGNCTNEAQEVIDVAGRAGEGIPEGAPQIEQVVQNGLDFRNADLLADHFARHGADIGAGTPAAYLEGARNLFEGGQGVETFMRAGGDTLFYRAATNEFGVLSADGFIRTFFAPEQGIDYWLQQIGGQ